MRLVSWIEQHPRTVAWIAVMTTLNFLITAVRAILDFAGVT